jgi:putative MATE family efflux protein
MTKTYVSIIFIGCLPLFGYNSVSGVLRGLGDSRTPLIFLIISTILNVVLDLIFILIFKWGVAGAAWATIISQGVSFILGLLYLERTGHQFLRFRIQQLKFDVVVFKKSIYIGLPSAIQQILVSIGMMALMRIVNGFGTVVIAAYTAASRIDSMAILPAMNISIAISTFTGQNLGAGKLERVKRGMLAGWLMALIISLAITLISIIFRKSLIALFLNNTETLESVEIIEIGAQYLMIVSSFYFAFTTMFIFNGVLRGAGDTIVPMFVTLLSLWFIRIPLSALLSQRIGTVGIWWGIPIAWLVGMCLAIAYYLTGNWKKKTII